MLLNFLVVQFVPGGPVEQAIANLTGAKTGDGTISGGGSEIKGDSSSNSSQYKGSIGLDQDIIDRLEKRYGFDKPSYERFFIMMKDYVRFDLGESFFLGEKVTDLIVQKLPVSISLGVWGMLLAYLISIPLGIKRAVNNGSVFDVSLGFILTIGYAVPVFLLAVILLVVFSGGVYLDWFPLRGLVSADFDSLSIWGKIKDYFWHLTLPLIASSLGSFTYLTALTKNSFLDQITQQYVITARAKGLTERKVLYNHVFRNGMLIVIAGAPAMIIGALFTSTLLVEIIFSLDGLGLLSWNAIMSRDYPVVLGTLWLTTLLGLILGIISDLMYVVVDPRIDFEKTS